jgi:hypothetical protein
VFWQSAFAGARKPVSSKLKAHESNAKGCFLYFSEVSSEGIVPNMEPVFSCFS